MRSAARAASPDGTRNPGVPPDRPEAAAAKTPRWQRYGSVAQWVSAISAVLLLGFFVEQAVTFTRNAREASARQIYISYTDAGYRHPDFIAPDYDAIKADPQRLALYRWFVSHMLWAYDEAIDSMREDFVARLFRYGLKMKRPEDIWIAAFRSDLSPHLRFLCDYATADVLAQFERTTARIIVDEMSRSNQPECRQRFKR